MMTLVSISLSIFRIIFPETRCHAKTNAYPTRDYDDNLPGSAYLQLLTDTPESMLPDLSSPTFKKYGKKQARQHTRSTVLTHTNSGAKSLHWKGRPGTRSTPELDVHNIHTLSLRTVFLKSTDDG